MLDSAESWNDISLPGVLQHLTLSVSDGIFTNPVGAAVVWSPAVPGSILDCSVRGNTAEAEAYFPSCMPSETAHEWKQAPVNLSLLQDALEPLLHESDSSKDLSLIHISEPTRPY